MSAKRTSGLVILGISIGCIFCALVLLLGIRSWGQNALPILSPSSIDVALGNVAGIENFPISGVSATVSDTLFLLLEPQSRATYPFPQAAFKVRIKAGGNAADDINGAGAQKIRVWCILDDFTRKQIVLDTAGVSASGNSVELCVRVNRARVEQGGDYEVGVGSNIGAIIVELADGTEVRRIEPGVGVDTQLVFSTGADEKGVLVFTFADINSSNTCSFKSYIRIAYGDVTGPSYGPTFLFNEQNGLSGAVSIEPVDGKIAIDELTDLFTVVRCDVLNAEVTVNTVIQRIEL